MIKAIIFDVDGTLLDTEPIYMWAWREAGKRIGKPMTEEVLLRTRGVNVKESIPIFRECLGEDFDYAKARVFREVLAEERIEKEGVQLKPYVLETLRFLKENGIRMAVASSTKTEWTHAHLRAAGIEDWFEVIVGGDQVINGKPNPDIFLHAAKLLGVSPEDCMVVEDSPMGVQAAYTAKMRPILIPDLVPANETSIAQSFKVLRSMEELPDVIKD